MSALLPKSLVGLSMKPNNRTDEIERFMREHPEKVEKCPPVGADSGPPQVAEQFDRVQIGTTWGAYRRRNHRGSADQ
jgi:hypothetical protein